MSLYNEIARVYKGETTDNGYIRAYGNGDRDGVIASIYVKYNSVFYGVSKKYVSISDDEKESIIIGKIWEAMEFLQANELSAKLSTLISTFITRELTRVMNSNKYNKRKINEECISFTDLTVDDSDATDKYMEIGEVDDVSMIEMVSFLDSKQLSANQRLFCDIALRGETPLKPGSIANVIGVSRAGAKKIVESLRKTCAELIY